MITDIDEAHEQLQAMISDCESDLESSDMEFTDDMVADLFAGLSYDLDDDTALELARREFGFYPGGARHIEGSDYVFMGY